jgi:hypothetical protein
MPLWVAGMPVEDMPVEGMPVADMAAAENKAQGRRSVPANSTANGLQLRRREIEKIANIPTKHRSMKCGS